MAFSDSCNTNTTNPPARAIAIRAIRLERAFPRQTAMVAVVDLLAALPP